ncbi:TetR family transcriptional regulator [Paraburkholderia sp.]|uniref:TetR family transcriptional regulator n=1 Tax=Paraburkholderia sp. TaxID=1926495 RepID=UPI003D6EFBDD
MKRTRQHALDTRAHILDAAEHVFIQRGLSRASLSDVADAAGVTRGAVYGHFRNKLAVFEALFDDASLPVDPFLVEAGGSGDDPLGQLQRNLTFLLTQVLSAGSARRLYTILLSRCEPALETEVFWHRMDGSRRHAETQIEHALRAAMSCNQLRPDLDARRTSAVIHASLTGFFLRSLREPLPPQPDAEARRVVSSIVQGLGSGIAVE